MTSTVDTRPMRSLTTSTMELQMPSKSAKQARMMRGAAHDKSFAKKVGVPQDVAREFVRADKRKRKYKTGSK